SPRTWPSIRRRRVMFFDFSSGSTAAAWRELADASRTAHPHSAAVSAARAELLLLVGLTLTPRRSRQTHPAQSKTVCHYTHRAESHRRAGEYRAQHGSSDWVKHARGNRDSDHVVDESPEQVLPHGRHCSARQRYRGCDATEIASHQRDVARLDRDVSSPRHRHADV